MGHQKGDASVAGSRSKLIVMGAGTLTPSPLAKCTLSHVISGLRFLLSIGITVWLGVFAGINESFLLLWNAWIWAQLNRAPRYSKRRKLERATDQQQWDTQYFPIDWCIIPQQDYRVWRGVRFRLQYAGPDWRRRARVRSLLVLTDSWTDVSGIGNCPGR